MKMFLLLIAITINNLSFIFSKQARCFMIPDGNSGVSGEVLFTQEDENSIVKMEVKVYGAKSIHGFHIHEIGSIEAGCVSAGPHFNPDYKVHGAPDSDTRHMGDLGNLKSDGRSILYKFEDKKISLFNKNTIIGRTCVIHAKQDDLGKGGDEESLKTGNSGPRIACGLVQTFDPMLSIVFGLVVLTLGVGLSIYYFFFMKRVKPNENLPDNEENKHS